MFLAKKENSVNVLVNGTIVAKHGSHDQKTHGRKGGKGTVNPSTGETREKIANEVSNTMHHATNDFMDEIENLEDRAETNRERRTLRSARASLESARTDFMGAKKLKGKAQTEKIQSGLNKYEGAMERISGLDIYRMDVEQTIQNAYDKIPDAIREIGVESSLDI